MNSKKDQTFTTSVTANEQNGGSNNHTKNDLKNSETSFYFELSDVMLSIRESMIRAQKNLDWNSYLIQGELRNTPNYAEYPLNATWFAIKETEVELKANIIAEKDDQGLHLLFAPFNAEFSNFFSKTIIENK